MGCVHTKRTHDTRVKHTLLILSFLATLVGCKPCDEPVSTTVDTPTTAQVSECSESGGESTAHEAPYTCAPPGQPFGRCLEGACEASVCVTTAAGSVCQPACAECAADMWKKCTDVYACFPLKGCGIPCTLDAECVSGVCDEEAAHCVWPN